MKRRKEKNAWRMLALISQLGICMLTSIFICVFLGWWLVQKLHQDLLFPLMVVIGIMAGVRSCYKVIQKFVDLKDNCYLTSSETSKTHYEGKTEEEFYEKKELDDHETDKMDRRNG